MLFHFKVMGTWFQHYIIITKTSPCNVDPITPHFYVVKLGFARVYIFFFTFASKNRLWVLVSITVNVLSKTKKKYHLKINIFTAVKYCFILHGRVCVMFDRLKLESGECHI